MIKEIIIENYSIIKNINIEFSRGLNVLTGETGAGKTVLIGALGLAMGLKIDKNIKIKDKKAKIITLVEVDNSIIEYLNDMDIEVENPLIIKRIIDKDRKSKVYINDNLISIKTLNKIGEMIIDFHGQHEHQMLLKKDYQLKIIDSIAENYELLEQYKLILEEYNKKNEELIQLKNKISEYEKEKEFMNFALKELEEADIENIDELQLEERLFELEHFQELKDGLSNILMISSVDENCNVLQQIIEINRQLKNIKLNNKQMDNVKETFENIRILLEEAIRDSELIQQELYYDEQELIKLREKMSMLERLKQKYKMNLQELIAYKEQISKRLNLLSAPEETVEKLKFEIEALYTQLIDLARNIHNRRKESANRILNEINKNLQALNMKDTELSAHIEFDIDNIKSNGMDQFELLIKNRFSKSGQSLKNIVSGGELSRIMLALKNSVFKNDPISTLIFDEIDAGISGKTAELAAKLLKKISKDKQLIVITHLPQIAAKAEEHFVVNKMQDTISIKKLNKQERVEEIARLLGSSISKDTAIKHAKALLREK